MISCNSVGGLYRHRRRGTEFGSVVQDAIKLMDQPRDKENSLLTQSAIQPPLESVVEVLCCCIRWASVVCHVLLGICSFFFFYHKYVVGEGRNVTASSFALESEQNHLQKKHTKINTNFFFPLKRGIANLKIPAVSCARKSLFMK